MYLLCPICQQELKKIDRSAKCANNHSFDFAKQGYLNVLIKQSVDHGDNKDMVKARTAFLNTGAYGFLKAHLVQHISSFSTATFIDLGCGEGYYTKDILAAEKFGFDMSKEALKHASSIDQSTTYAVASIFHLPLADESVDVALTCFAPAALEELDRVLKPHGKFVFVTPGPKHLWEMKEVLYQTPYLNEVKPLETTLRLVDTTTITNPFTLNHAELMNLFGMTPYAHRSPKEGIARLEQVEQLTLTAEFVIRTFEK